MANDGKDKVKLVSYSPHYLHKFAHSISSFSAKAASTSHPRAIPGRFLDTYLDVFQSIRRFFHRENEGNYNYRYCCMRSAAALIPMTVVHIL